MSSQLTLTCSLNLCHNPTRTRLVEVAETAKGLFPIDRWLSCAAFGTIKAVPMCLECCAQYDVTIYVIITFQCFSLKVLLCERLGELVCMDQLTE